MIASSKTLELLENRPSKKDANRFGKARPHFKRASRFYASRDLRVQEIKAPEVCRPKQVIVKVAWCGICGTDLHEYVMGPIFMPRQQPSVGPFPDRAGDSLIIKTNWSPE